MQIEEDRVKDYIRNIHPNLTVSQETLEWINVIFDDLLKIDNYQELINSLNGDLKRHASTNSTIELVMKYLIEEILELSGNSAIKWKSNTITPKHLFTAIYNDDELRLLFKDSMTILPITPDLTPKAIDLNGKPVKGNLKKRIKDKNVKVNAEVEYFILNILIKASNIYVEDEFENTYFNDFFKYGVKSEEGLKYFHAIVSDILLDKLKIYQDHRNLKILTFTHLNTVVFDNRQTFNFLRVNI